MAAAADGLGCAVGGVSLLHQDACMLSASTAHLAAAPAAAAAAAAPSRRASDFYCPLPPATIASPAPAGSDGDTRGAGAGAWVSAASPREGRPATLSGPAAGYLECAGTFYEPHGECALPRSRIEHAPSSASVPSAAEAAPMLVQDSAGSATDCPTHTRDASSASAVLLPALWSPLHPLTADTPPPHTPTASLGDAASSKLPAAAAIALDSWPANAGGLPPRYSAPPDLFSPLLKDVLDLASPSASDSSLAPTWDGHGSASVCTDSSSSADNGPDAERPQLSVPRFAVVRATVPSGDDPDMPINTLRVWILGPLTSLGFAALFSFFSVRGYDTTIIAGGILAQCVCWPVGYIMSKFPYPAHWPAANFVNPGPFNVKEHSLICIMASFGPGPEWFIEALTVHKMHVIGSPAPWGYQILLGWSSCLLGFALAGIGYRVLVLPARMLWPQVLQTSALLVSLHRLHASNWSRTRLFWATLVAAFVWTWVPGYLFTSLSIFSWLAWCAPDNYVLNWIGGGMGGAGLTFLTWDWDSILQALTSPLILPYAALANVFAGYLGIIVILGALIMFTGSQYGIYLPWVSLVPYDRFGMPYKVGLVAPVSNTSAITVDLDAYHSYSRVYFPTTSVLSFGAGFALVPALLMHFLLFHSRSVWHDFATDPRKTEDLHARLSLRHALVPFWAWCALFLASFGMGLATIRDYPTGLPIWAFLLSNLLSVLFVLPMGVLLATTGIHLSIPKFCELLTGHMLPGKALPLILFRLYTSTILNQSLQLLSQLKLGVYFKLPPRVVVLSVVATKMASILIQVGVTSAYPAGDGGQMLYYDSVVWGVLGSRHMFGWSSDATYRWVNWFFLIGFVCPLFTFILHRSFPGPRLAHFRWNKVLWPLIFFSAQFSIGWNSIAFTSWFLCGSLFHLLLHPRFGNYFLGLHHIVSAALTAGTAMTYFLLALLPLPPLTWWGNSQELRTRQALFPYLEWDIPGLYLHNISLLSQEGAFAPTPLGLWSPAFR